jgi:hypothetical protein
MNQQIAMRDDLVIRAMALAHLVNAHTNYCVFIYYSGHVNNVGIRLAESKANFNRSVLETEFYSIYKEHMAKGNSCPELQAKVDLLKRILVENEIPFDDLEYSEEVVREYSF